MKAAGEAADGVGASCRASVRVWYHLRVNSTMVSCNGMRRVTLAILLVGGLLLRLPGLESGLPYPWHPDEGALVNRAAAMVRTGDLNPHWFSYPSFTLYMQAAGMLLLPATDGDSTPQVYRAGRLQNAVWGAATIPLLYAC
ncbi:MAG TPA: hypothetical protein PKM88_14180, partial [bacterium]|nr:hypothetical protein [bacterium]